jgi:hypothetical protein
MMSREQRIDYEILDNVFKAHPVCGYATDSRTFTDSLLALFSDIQPDVRRQLFLWVDDNYFSLSTTITS